MEHKVQRRAIPAPVRRAQRSLAESMTTWRKLRGLTQAQLAERADVSRGVSVENLLRILRALGIQQLLSDALDPLASDIGRMRADQELPRRVRPRRLTGDG
jgi:transcriptional regulator with XRE-family HTH domain